MRTKLFKLRYILCFGTTVGAVAIGANIQQNVCTIAWVDGLSMQPTLNPERQSPPRTTSERIPPTRKHFSTDIIWLNRWYAKSSCYNRGDVVVLK